MTDKESYSSNNYYANKMVIEDDDYNKNSSSHKNSSNISNNYNDSYNYTTNNSNINVNQNNTKSGNSNYTDYSKNSEINNLNSTLQNTNNQHNIQSNYANFQVVNNTKFEELEDTRELYIDCAKSTSALIPSSVRRNISFFNSVFVISGFSLIAFNLFGFVKFYPDTFTSAHKVFIKKNSIILGSATLGSYFMLKKLYNDSYEVFKGNKSDSEVRATIQQFYNVNKENLNNSLSNKSN